MAPRMFLENWYYTWTLARKVRANSEPIAPALLALRIRYGHGRPIITGVVSPRPYPRPSSHFFLPSLFSAIRLPDKGHAQSVTRLPAPLDQLRACLGFDTSLSARSLVTVPTWRSLSILESLSKGVGRYIRRESGGRGMNPCKKFPWLKLFPWYKYTRVNYSANRRSRY